MIKKIKKNRIFGVFLLLSKISDNLSSANALASNELSALIREEQPEESMFVRPEIVARTESLHRNPVYKKFQSHLNKQHTPSCIKNFLCELFGPQDRGPVFLAFLKTEEKKFIYAQIYCTCDQGGLHFSYLQEKHTTSVPARNIFILPT